MKSSRTRKVAVTGTAAVLISAIPVSVAAAAGGQPGGLDSLAVRLTSGSPFDREFAIASGPLSGDTLSPTPDSFQVSGFYGPQVGQPGQLDTFQGTETFDVKDGDTTLGTVSAVVSHSVGPGNPNLEIVVTGVDPANGVAPDQLPTIGSVFNFGWSPGNPSVLTNTYADIAGANALLPGGVAPADVAYGGGVPTNGSAIGWAFNPDDSEHLLVQTALAHPDDFIINNGYLTNSGIAGDDHIVAVPGTEHITAVTNTSPYAIAVQGVGQFQVVDPSGNVVGTFDGNTISTADFAGGHSYEIEVTGDQMMGAPTGPQTAATSADLGSGADQLPRDGSIFNMLYLFSPDAYNDYIDEVGAGPNGTDQISQLWNVFGATAWTYPAFDAAKDMTVGGNLFDTIPLVLADGQSTSPITPIGTLDVTGVNGMPNGGVNGMTSDVLGQQEFSVGGHDFWAYVEDYRDGNGVTAESLYLDPALNAEHGTGLTGLPDNLAAGDEIDYAHSSWWESLQIQPDAVDGGVDPTQMFEAFGGPWEVFDPATDGWLQWLGLTF